MISFESLFQLLTTLLASLFLGQRLRRFFNFNSLPLDFCLQTGLGLSFISFLTFFLTLFYTPVSNTLNILFLTVMLLAFVQTVIMISQLLKSPALISQMGPFSVYLLLPAAIYLIWILLCLALPPMARDTLIYHLAIPKSILDGKNPFFALDNIYAYFPQFGEMLMLFALQTGGEFAAKSYDAIYGILLSISIYGFSRQFISKNYAVLAGTLFLTIPSVVVLMSAAYVDLCFVFYTFLGVISLFEYFKSLKVKWIFLSGILFGISICVKYTGLQFLMLTAILLLIHHLSERTKTIAKAFPVLMLTALLIPLPYLLRNWMQTGWPLFPFNYGQLALNPLMNWDTERARLYVGWAQSFGAPIGEATIWHTLFAPILVFIRARFEEQTFYDGMIGPVFLAVPFLLFKSKKTKEIKWLCLFAGFFLYYWAVSTKQVRFFLPIMPILCFLLAYGLQQIKNTGLNIIVIIFMIISFGLGAHETLKWKPFDFWRGQEDREIYLMRRLGNYPIYQLANKTLGPQDRLYMINMKNYGYYLNMPWRADFIFERAQIERMLAKSASPQDFLHFFRSLKITHILIDYASLTLKDVGLKPEEIEVLADFFTENTQLISQDRQFALYKLN